MKKVTLLCLTVFLVAFNAKAQLTYDLTDSASVSLTSAGSSNASIDYTNTGSITDTFKYRIVDYFFPVDWQGNGISDWLMSYPHVDTNWHKLHSPPSQTNTVSVQVTRKTGAGPGCAIVRIEYKGLGQFSHFTDLVVTSFTSPTLCNPLSINNIQQKENTLKIYPNPSSGLFTIELTDKWGRIENVSVYDARGRKMQASYKQQQLNASNLASGVYFVRITNAKAEVIVERVVIQ